MRRLPAPLARVGTLAQPLVLLLLLATLTLGLGFQFKDQCNQEQGWGGGYVWRAMCYSDIVPLYGIHGFDRGVFPYTAHPEMDAENPKGCSAEERAAHPVTCQWGFVEYPVLTGILMWAAARTGQNVASWMGEEANNRAFLYANAAYLAAFALATLVLLYRMVPEPRRVAYFAAGTPLLLYVFHNWDMMAVFFVVLCLYWFERRRFVASGVALSLGVSAKLFPIVLAPLLYLVLVRRAYEHHPAADDLLKRAWLFFRSAFAPAAMRLTAGTVGGLALVNGPFLIWGSREIFLEVFRFHARRTPNFETLWFVARHHTERWGWDIHERLRDREWLDAALLLLFILAFTGLALATWFRRWGAREAAFGGVLAFLLLNKIFSAQYALWVLPFFALVPLPAWSYAAFAAADAWVYTSLFPMFDLFGDGQRFEDHFNWVSLAVLARTLTLAILMALLVADVRARSWRGGGTSRPLPRLPRTGPTVAPSGP
jgi:uncharacterized membrane protein